MPEMPLPAAYRWIDAVAQPPRMLAAARALYGTAEAPGAADNPAILDWASEIGATTYHADATPWCGLFLGLIAHRAGNPLPPNPLRALSWQRFGMAAERPMLADTLVFRRPGGGHVGLYVGEDDAAFHVLGGNEGDRVAIARIARARLVAARRPVYSALPSCVRPVRLAASGALSADEA